MKPFFLSSTIAAALLGGGCTDPRCEVVGRRERGDPGFQTTSLLGRRLYARSEGDDLNKHEAQLAGAEARLDESPGDPEGMVWVGRRLGYLWRMREAIEVFSQGIEVHPEYAPLYRHRGHRHISLREFETAITDLEKAVLLMEGGPDAIEQDGMPNERNIPLTTTGFNVWYHLALARYLTGDFEGALDGYRKTMEYTRGVDDNVVAVSDWMYMTLRRMGRDDEAAAVLERIAPVMEIIENDAYHRRLLMYRGEIEPGELLNLEDATELDIATLGYGLGNWYLCNGDEARASEVFERVVSGPYWPAFGFIAAEADLAGLRAGSDR